MIRKYVNSKICKEAKKQNLVIRKYVNLIMCKQAKDLSEKDKHPIKTLLITSIIQKSPHFSRELQTR